MLRRVLTVLWALSLLLCVAVVVLWVRSYSANDGWVDARRGYVSFGRLGHGKLMVMTVDREPGVHGFERLQWAAWVDWEQRPTAPGAFTSSHTLAANWVPGFRAYTGTQDYVVRAGNADLEQRFSVAERPFRLVVVSYWIPFLLTLLPLTPFILRRIRRLIPRRVPGLCARCGYDLRATPGRCPECGTLSTEAKA
jgi:hypothetical protein